MSGAPTIVMKGRIIRAIDERLKNPQQKYLDELEAMGRAHRLSDLALQNNHGTIKPGDKHHVDVEWFGTGKGSWWPKLLKKEEKVRCAYVHALEIALRYQPVPRPIRSYWVAGVPDLFQCYVHDDHTVEAVFVFWVTPKPPKVSAPSSDQVLDDLWLIGTPEEIQVVRDRIPDGYGSEDPQPCGGGISLFKSTGY